MGAIEKPPDLGIDQVFDVGAQVARRDLVAMIGIRTMLSWTMVLEMSGRWPWQQAPATESQSTA